MEWTRAIAVIHKKRFAEVKKFRKWRENLHRIEGQTLQKQSFALTISFIRRIVPGKVRLIRNDEGLPPCGAPYARLWSEQ